MRTDSEIKALAEEKAKRFINGIEFNKWNNMEPFFRQTIISAMMEMYKAALSGAKKEDIPATEFCKGEVRDHKSACAGDWYYDEHGNEITVISVTDGWCMVRERNKKPFVVAEEFVLATFDK